MWWWERDCFKKEGNQYHLEAFPWVSASYLWWKKGEGKRCLAQLPSSVTLLPMPLCSAFLVLDARSLLLREQVGPHAGGRTASLRACCVQVWLGPSGALVSPLSVALSSSNFFFPFFIAIYFSLFFPCFLIRFVKAYFYCFVVYRTVFPPKK